MNKTVLGIMLALFGSTQSNAAAPWPELPTSGFITGRLATEEDLRHGDAVFLSLVDGRPQGTPAPIGIPQFAFLTEANGQQLPVIVVQAEVTEQGTILGLRDANGQDHVATAGEVLLLGSTHP